MFLSVELCDITSRMPKLKELRVIMTINHDHQARDKVEWMDRLFSNLPPTIRTIFLTVTGGVTGLDEMDWTRLDRMLERRKFDSLQNMIVDVKTYGMLPVIKWKLLEGLTNSRAVRQKRVVVL
jgi:hypothetical protein